MPFDEARYTLDEPAAIEMVALTGERLSVVVQTLDVAPTRVDLTGLVSSDTWEQAVRLGAFHVDLEPGELPDEPGADVEIVLTLRRPWIDRLDDSDELFRSLFTDDHADHTRHLQADAWVLASAMREVTVPDGAGATAASGYRTRWAPPPY